jgi:hypothetical protein
VPKDFRREGGSLAKPLALVAASDEAVAARFVMSAAARRLAEGLWPGDLALRLAWREPAHGRWWLGTDITMVTRDPGLLGMVAARTRNPPAAAASASATRCDNERWPALSPA